MLLPAQWGQHPCAGYMLVNQLVEAIDARAQWGQHPCAGYMGHPPLSAPGR